LGSLPRCAKDELFNSPRVHWTRNALAYVPRAQQTMVAAGLRHAFQQPDQEAARAALQHLAEQLHNRWPKLKGFIDGTSEDVLAYLTFLVQHRAKLHSTDVMDKRLVELRAIVSPARTTSWRSAEPRLQAPPGGLIQALPV
jgi:transposase-like protein